MKNGWSFIGLENVVYIHMRAEQENHLMADDPLDRLVGSHH